MQTKPEPRDVSPEALDRRHELRNPSVGGIMLFAGIIVLTVVICAAGIWYGMKLFYSSRPADKFLESRGVIISPDAKLLVRFPAPNLQMNPQEDLRALRAREDAEIVSYGWVDRSNGIIRMPVERAMDLILQRGLPVRASNTPPRTGKSSLELIQERAQER